MDTAYNILTATLKGLFDSIKGISVIFYLDKEVNKRIQERENRRGESMERSFNSETKATTRFAHRQKDTKRDEESKVLKRVLQCCALNGGVFWLSIAFFEYLVLPTLKFVLTRVFSDETGIGPVIWSWVQPFLSLFFGMLWVMPLFILSKIVNSLWFQDIADSAYKFRKGRPQLIPNISKLIADTLFSLLVQALFLVQAMLAQKLPGQYAGPFLCFFHTCLLYSLYSFEYKWFNMGWELHKRLTYIEHNWPYFFGFGAPLAILTQLPQSYFVSGCVFSIVFPLFILSANEATPLCIDPANNNIPLKLFSPVVAISNTLFSKTVGKKRQVQIAQQQATNSPGTAASGQMSRSGSNSPGSGAAAADLRGSRATERKRL